LYNDILNHPNTPDDLRRITESKLLRHKQRYLHALPSSGKLSSTKAQIASEVEGLVSGAVLLGIPDELAWTIFIDGKNTDSIGQYTLARSIFQHPLMLTIFTEGYDFTSLRQFISLFPSRPLTKLLKGYFAYIGAPLPREDQEDQESLSIQQEEDSFDVVLVRILTASTYVGLICFDQDAFTALSESIFANRIVADIYLKEEDYHNAIRMAESGLELVRRSEIDNAKTLTQ
jgi:superkiller protein 3